MSAIKKTAAVLCAAVLALPVAPAGAYDRVCLRLPLVTYLATLKVQTLDGSHYAESSNIASRQRQCADISGFPDDALLQARFQIHWGAETLCVHTVRPDDWMNSGRLNLNQVFQNFPDEGELDFLVAAGSKCALGRPTPPVSPALAAQRGDAGALRELLAYGAEAPPPESVALAARNGHAEVLNILLSRGVDIPPDAARRAIVDGNLPILGLLLAGGASLPPDAVNLAARGGDLRMLDFVVGRGAAVSPDVVRDAVRRRDAESLAVMLSYGASVPPDAVNLAAQGGDIETLTTLLIHRADPAGDPADLNSPLHRAVALGKAVNVQYLLAYAGQHGKLAQVANARDNRGRTPLHLVFAEFGDHPDATPLLETLLGGGADVDAADNDGNTVLHAAAAADHLDAIAALVGLGANVAARNNAGDTPLDIAARRGNTRAAVGLVYQNAPRNNTSEGDHPAHALDADGRAPLHLAAEAGDLEDLDFLLRTNANVNAPDRDGATPLHHALRAGHADAAQLLLERGADPNSADNGRRTPLYWAIHMNLPGVVRALVARGAKTDGLLPGHGTPLDMAQKFERGAIVEFLTAQGAPRAATRDPAEAAAERAARERVPPTHAAALAGDADAVRRLLDGGADPNAEGPNGAPALAYAVREARADADARAARLLLERGAHPDYADYDGDTPLHWAARAGHRAGIAVLLEFGANKSIANERKRLPVDEAAPEVRDLFTGESPSRAARAARAARETAEVEAGINDRNALGETRLHLAAAEGRVAEAADLLRRGADPNIRDGRGFTPLLLALSRDNPGDWDMTEMLLESGADASAADPEGRTSAWLAAHSGRTDILEMLAAFGADVEAPDRKDISPLRAAESRGHWEAAEFLRAFLGI